MSIRWYFFNAWRQIAISENYPTLKNYLKNLKWVVICLMGSTLHLYWKYLKILTHRNENWGFMAQIYIWAFYTRILAATFHLLREQTEKSSEMVTFSFKKPPLLHPFVDFRGSSPVEDLVIFRLFSMRIILDIFVLCQELNWSKENIHFFPKISFTYF